MTSYAKSVPYFCLMMPAIELLWCINSKWFMQGHSSAWCGWQSIIWAPSSEFVSSSIPSWQILTAHAQPFRGARDLALFLKVPLDSLLVWASSGGSGETARMRRLAWTFAARIGNKYQIRLTRSIYTDLLTLRYVKSYVTYKRLFKFRSVYHRIWSYRTCEILKKVINWLFVCIIFIEYAIYYIIT